MHTLTKLIAFFLVICCSKSGAQTLIRVGDIIRPPFVISEQAGLSIEFLRALNQVQTEFNFELVIVPTTRRLDSLTENWADVFMWDNPDWGWKKSQISTSVPLLNSREFYLTLRSYSESQSIFDKLSLHSIAGVRGYHYSFVNYETDPEILINEHNMVLVKSELDALTMLTMGRVKMAITSDSAFNWFLLRNRNYKESAFLISDKSDSKYQRFFLIPPVAKISPEAINQIVRLADNRDLLQKIYKKYRLVKPTF